MKQAWIALRAVLFFTLLCGFCYPLFITFVGHSFFAAKAGGNLVKQGGTVVGSVLVAQGFAKDTHFWPRPSAGAYQPLPSGGTNLGPTSQILKKRVSEDQRRGAMGEMLYASASGLDPHLSPEAALAQVARVARARGRPRGEVEKLVRRQVESRQFGFMGEERVNVFLLNRALDAEYP